MLHLLVFIPPKPRRALMFWEEVRIDPKFWIEQDERGREFQMKLL